MWRFLRRKNIWAWGTLVVNLIAQGGFDFREHRKLHPFIRLLPGDADYIFAKVNVIKRDKRTMSPLRSPNRVANKTAA